MYQGRLVETEPLSDVPRYPEVWVLVDAARNEAWNVSLALQRFQEARHRLDAREEYAPYVVGVVEPEHGPYGREVDLLRRLDRGRVHRLDVLRVEEDVGQLKTRIEAFIERVS